jgi:DNA repair photolyase
MHSITRSTIPQSTLPFIGPQIPDGYATDFRGSDQLRQSTDLWVKTAISESALWKKHLGDWVLNPYVGCEHGCHHCFCPTMPGVKFFNNGHNQREWGKYLIPKHGIVEALRKELEKFTPAKAKRTEWGDGWVLMSFLTDCYTPSEATFKLTRQCLQLLLESGHKVRLQTRSALVERDFDLLVAHKNQVLLGTSLPYFDDALARTLEPRATGPTRRLKMLRNAVDLGLEVYVAVAPFMPFHGEAEMDSILKAVEPLNPREIFCEVLNPKGSNIEMMLAALAGHPEYAAHAEALKGYSDEAWAAFTILILQMGLRKSRRFIPWPDTGRAWSKYLSQEQVEFLNAFLPPKAMIDASNS